jgi:hypothetical protein
MAKHLKRARAAMIIIVGIAIVVIGLPLVVPAQAQSGPTGAELGTCLYRVGLGPEPLAAAGVSAGQTTALVEPARLYLIDHQRDLNLADAAYAGAKRNRDRLERLVRSGTGTEDDLTALAQARIDLANARTQRAAELAALLDAATTGLTGRQRATLDTLSDNASWKQPIEFHTVDRDQEDWVALREALANERIAARRQRTPDPGAQALLQQFRADPAVSAARVNLDSNLLAVTAAWELAVGE